MKNLLKGLNRSDLISTSGMTTELGWKTKRTDLNGLKECEDWLRTKPENSVELSFEDDTTLVKSHFCLKN